MQFCIVLMMRRSGNMKHLLYIIIFLSVGPILMAQSAPNTVRLSKEGGYMEMIIDGCDTTFVTSIEAVSISSPRTFDTNEEYLRYLKYKRYAAKVYPYAKQAIRIHRETEFVTRNMSKKQRRKHLRRLNRELKREFSDKLKKLTKTQGKILVEMIEKEIDIPLYYFIKDVRNGLTATKWSTLSGLYGYKLKEGYIEGQDPILDAVLQDLDISYDIELNIPEDFED